MILTCKKAGARLLCKLAMLNTKQYIEMRKEGFYQDSIANLTSYRPPNINNAPDLLLWDTTRYTDWQKTLIGGTAQFTNANASVSGGTSAAQYLLGGTYQRETSVFPCVIRLIREGMYINFNSTSLNKKFDLQLTGRLLFDKMNRCAMTLPAWLLVWSRMLQLCIMEDGTINWMPNALGRSSFLSNPAIQFERKYQNKSTNFIGNAVISYQVLFLV